MTRLFASAAPVFKVDGETRGELARDVLRLEIDENTEGLKTLSLRLLAQGPRNDSREEGLLYLEGSRIDFGQSLEVSIGRTGDDRTVFKGTISALEASFQEGSEPEVVVFAEDKLMQLRMTRRCRTYKDVTDADIAQAIASEHGLSAQMEAPGPTYDVVQQWNQSDLAFLRDRARLIQAELWVQDDALHFKTRGNRRASELTLVQGNELIEARLRADLAHQRTSVAVSGFDAFQRDAIHQEAGTDVLAEEVSEGRTGASILQSALGERASHRVRNVPLASGEADAWARAELLRRGRRFVTVTGITSGSPSMEVGSRLTLERVGRPFNGAGYYVTRVRHTYDLTHGHRTHFDAERPTVSENT
ncbi:phage late control D family protein [Hyalangium versicolor]|uniref:phage late control D family protein n=1 Tax=Hyalangium versicolor TaxID=2861190 RepID=UPI001CCF7938|nr:contractile injection system protein, VgrG/Pvc8 family [Hyalangium versicolor]